MYVPPHKRNSHNIIHTKLRAKSKKIKSHIVHKGAELTNKIPTQIRTMPYKQFSKQLELFIKANNV